MNAGKVLWTGLVASFLLASAISGLVAEPRSPWDLLSTSVPTKTVVHKKTPQRNLQLYIFDPAGWKSSDTRPAMVFFHDGGWTGAHASHFFAQSANLVRRALHAPATEIGKKGIRMLSCKPQAWGSVGLF
jgi:acetyl esterase/lipase